MEKEIFKYWIFDHPFDGGPLGPFKTSDEAFGELYELNLAECGCEVRLATISELRSIFPEIWGDSEEVYYPENGWVEMSSCGSCSFCEAVDAETRNCALMRLLVFDKTKKVYYKAENSFENSLKEKA